MIGKNLTKNVIFLERRGYVREPMEELIDLQLMIFSLIALGLLVKKIGMIGEVGQKNLTDLVVNLILPCNIIEAFMVKFSMDIASDFFDIFIISLLIQAGCVALGHLLFRRTTPARRKCLRYGTICSNAGFMGNPVAEGVFGPMGLTLASVYLIPQRVMMWSEGVAVFTEAPGKKELAKKVLTHPCILACFIGLFFMLTGLRPPQFVSDVTASVGDCNTAVSMMVIGMILADANPRTLLDKDILFYTILRLLLLPFLVWIPCRLLQVNSLVTGVSVLLAAMPAGATTTILAAKYNGDAEFAVKMVVFSTAISLVTTPLWSVLLL